VVNIHQEREGGTMNRKSGAFSLPWIYAKQEALEIDGIFALVVGLVAFALALVVILLVMAFAEPEMPPGIADGVGVGSARWSVLGQFYSPDNEGSQGAGVAQTLVLDEAHARSLALTGQGRVGPVGCPFSAPGAAPASDPDEACARSLALTGQGWIGAASGPSSAPKAAPAFDPDEIYARSLALTGQGRVGPVGCPFSAPGAAPPFDPDEACARSLALTGQGWVGPVVGQ
jgi:hypothetical protein